MHVRVQITQCDSSARPLKKNQCTTNCYLCSSTINVTVTINVNGSVASRLMATLSRSFPYGMSKICPNLGPNS